MECCKTDLCDGVYRELEIRIPGKKTGLCEISDIYKEHADSSCTMEHNFS
jgi:hypothetical protein